MFKVLFSRQSRVNIKKFIDSYRSIYFLLYSDTGIDGEDEIIDNYIKLSQILSGKISSTIIHNLEQENILGTSKLEDNTLSITRKCEGFFLKMEYSENKKLQERKLINITFYKK